MNAAAKQQSKQRWVDCETILKFLDDQRLTKHHVHNYLYGDLVRSGKLGKALEGDPEVINWLRSTDSWQQMMNELTRPKVRAYRPKNKKDEDLADDPESQLKVAMWFIRKVGSVEQAKVALDIAAQALTKLSRKSDTSANA